MRCDASRRTIALTIAALFLSLSALRAQDLEARRAVLVISVDGLRPDALSPERTPAIWNLYLEGASTLEARSLEPHYTIPNHASIFSGLVPQTHGFLELSDPGDKILDGSLFEHAHAAGLRTALYIGKDRLRFLNKPGTLDRYVLSTSGTSDELVEQLLEDFGVEPFDVVGLHFAEPDTAGHSHKWMSPEYLDAVAKVDQLMAQLLDGLSALPVSERLFVILTADHGGFASGHGGTSREEKTIPWIAWGSGARSAHRIESDVATYDTFATAIWALGLDMPPGTEGLAVSEAFAEAPVYVLPGDFAPDGVINLSDPIALLSYLFVGAGAECVRAGDLDRDSNVTVSDGIYLLDFLFRDGPPPPHPFPTCAPTSTYGETCIAPCREARPRMPFPEEDEENEEHEEHPPVADVAPDDRFGEPAEPHHAQ